VVGGERATPDRLLSEVNYRVSSWPRIPRFVVSIVARTVRSLGQKTK